MRTNSSGIHEHAACPSINIIFLNKTAHGAHPRALFIGWHAERHMQSGRALMNIVRINNQSFR
jgi:hypothetical protein